MADRRKFDVKRRENIYTKRESVKNGDNLVAL